MIVIIFICILTYFFRIDYCKIASEGITVVSIVLAIYMTSFSNLLSSELADKMKKTQDKQIWEKSQMGVLRGYLNIAVGIGIINIILGIITLMLENNIDSQYIVFYECISSFGFGTLGANIYMMYLLYKFMVNRQMWNT